MIIKTLAFNLHEPGVSRCGGRLIVDRSRNSQPKQLSLSFLPLCPVLASGFWDFFFVTHPPRRRLASSKQPCNCGRVWCVQCIDVQEDHRWSAQAWTTSSLPLEPRFPSSCQGKPQIILRSLPPINIKAMNHIKWCSGQTGVLGFHGVHVILTPVFRCGRCGVNRS